MTRSLLPRHGLVLILSGLVGACGGGGDGGSGPASLTGTIRTVDGSITDGDVNDPAAPFASNSTAADAQRLSNPATVGGFLAERPTGEAADRFGDRADEADYYAVTLAQGQQVTLAINAGDVNMDLELCRTNANCRQASASWEDRSIKTLTAEADGTHRIAVTAASGAGGYVLTVGQGISLGDDAAIATDFVPGEIIVGFEQERANGSKRRLSPSVGAATLGLQARGGEPGRPMLMSLGDARQRRQAFSVLGIDAEPLSANGGAQALRHDTLRVVKALRARPDVRYAAPNYRWRALRTPNDSLFDEQESLRLIRAPLAWDTTTGGPGVIVGLVDNGVFAGHGDLDGKLVPGFDLVSAPGGGGDGGGIDPEPDDPPGGVYHGTQVAGVLAAATNNALGIAGVSWGARIMPVRAIGEDAGSLYDVIQAIRYAAGLPNDSGRAPAQPAQIINLSLGGPGGAELAEAFEAVRQTGVVLAAAAGNDGTDIAFYPAAYPAVVGVGAIGADKRRAGYSNTGVSVDVAAPGGSASGRILTTSVDIDAASGAERSTYREVVGTSFAVPHVSGVAALMKTVYGALTPADFECALASGQITEDLAGDGALRNPEFGFGLIDAAAAVSYAAGLASGSAAPEPRLQAAPAALNFGTLTQRLSFELALTCDAQAAINPPTTDVPWLQLQPESGTGTPRQRWTATVDRSGLADGVNRGRIRITAANGSETVIAVTAIRDGVSPPSFSAGRQYVLLFTAQDFATGGEPLSQRSVNPNDGRYPYRFEDLPGGQYVVIAGTDLDNDLRVCEPGEACSAWRSRSDIEVLAVDGGRQRGIDFDTGFLPVTNTQTAGFARRRERPEMSPQP